MPLLTRPFKSLFETVDPLQLQVMCTVDFHLGAMLLEVRERRKFETFWENMNEAARTRKKMNITG